MPGLSHGTGHSRQNTLSGKLQYTPPNRTNARMSTRTRCVRTPTRTMYVEASCAGLQTELNQCCRVACHGFALHGGYSCRTGTLPNQTFVLHMSVDVWRHVLHCKFKSTFTCHSHLHHLRVHVLGNVVAVCVCACVCTCVCELRRVCSGSLRVPFAC